MGLEPSITQRVDPFVSQVNFHLKYTVKRGPVAQWITRLPTEQKIAGSSPAEVGCFEYSFLYDMLDSFIRT